MRTHPCTGYELETTSLCNAKCSFCPNGYINNNIVTNIMTGEKWERKKKKMDWNLMEEIFKVSEPDVIILCGQHEPFMDDRYFDIIELGRKYNPKMIVSTFTNANLLTDEKIERLVKDKQFASISFSLNAFTDETRMNVMGIPYKLAAENVMKFLEKRRELGRERAGADFSPDNQDLRVGMSYIEVDGYRNGEKVSNVDEVEPFKDHWNPILTEYHCNVDVGVYPGGNWGNFVPVDHNFTRYIDESPTGCGQWDSNSVSIDVDGNINLCCYNHLISFGSFLNVDNYWNFINKKKIFNVTSEKKYYGESCEKCTFRFVPHNFEHMGGKRKPFIKKI